MFKTSQICINNHGIDIIKNYQAQRHIDYLNITNCEIRKGHWIRRWRLSLFVGLVFLFLSLVWALSTMNNGVSLGDEALSSRGFVFYLVAPWLLIIGSSTLILASFRKSVTIFIQGNNWSNETSIKEFEKSGQLKELGQFLQIRIKHFSNNLR